MTLLMAGNEFCNVNCKGPHRQGKGVGQREQSHLAGHGSREWGWGSSGRQRHETCFSVSILISYVRHILF